VGEASLGLSWLRGCGVGDGFYLEVSHCFGVKGQIRNRNCRQNSARALQAETPPPSRSHGTQQA